MDESRLKQMDEQVEAERRAGSASPTGVVLGLPSARMNPYVSEELQGVDMTPKTFGPPQYGSPHPATAGSKLTTFEQGHPLDDLPEDHPAAISPDFAATVTEEEVDATDEATDLAEEENVDLAEVEGTGKEGRITKKDVQDYIDKRQG